MEAKRTAAVEGNIRVDSNTNIVDVKDFTLPTKEKAAKISFRFQTRYSQEKKEVGNIAIDGEVIYKGKTGDIKKYWKKEKSLPEEVGVKVINSILRKCIVKAVDLSDEIALPPPLNMPTVRSKKDSTPGYIG